MMIETSLIKLNEAVSTGQILSAGTKVILSTGDEAEIYGFIAIDEDMLSTHIDTPPLGECQVFSNRVIFYLEKQLHRFPIFKSVCKVSEECYGVYLLYVPKLLHLSTESSHRKYYKESMSKEKPHPQVWKIDGIRIVDKVAYYFPEESDLYFESNSKLRGIGTGFVVVIRRISPLTGNLNYEIFDSHSVMIELK